MKKSNQFMTRYRKAVELVKSRAYQQLRGSNTSPDETQRQYQLIADSGCFDAAYYLKKNTDVKKSGMDPLMHYVLFGGAEGRDPSGEFDSKYYLACNADVRESRANPLLHYLKVGQKEGRRTKHAISKTVKKSTRKIKYIDIINVNFYDWKGEVLYKGGAERYVYDLAHIVKKMGHKPRIIQNAVQDFTKIYKGIEVVGVVTGATDADGKSLRQMSAVFNEVCKDSDLIISSPLDLACEIYGKRVIGINHGIHWDVKTKRLYNNRTSDYSEIFDALQNIEVGVCVDTNFVNWTRTYDYELGEKLRYVPNYYDKKTFRKASKDFDGRIRAMYPRRLYDARGIYITLDAFDELLGQYKDLDLLLVGQTSDADVKKRVKAFMKKYPKQVTLEEYDMEDMHFAYEKSNVVLIPTRYAEGTSLSCLEAMATNNAVIATNIGGLPNLIVDGFNGLLIEPNTKALKEGMQSIVEDRAYAKTLAKNALEMVKVFEKSKWDARWKKILEEEL